MNNRTLNVQEELDLIHRYLPQTNNFEENFKTLRLLNLDEDEIEAVFSGEEAYIYGPISNPKTNDVYYNGATRIAVLRSSDDGVWRVHYNGQLPNEFFARLESENDERLDREQLLQTGRRLRQELRTYQDRCADLWELCKSMEQQLKQQKDKGGPHQEQ